MNKATLIGNLGHDPEMRNTKSGLTVCNFNLAVTEKKEGNEKTVWFTIVAWGKTAEICKQYLHKGDKVYVEGKIQPKSWTSKDGTAQFGIELTANQVVFLSTPKKAGEAVSNPIAPQAAKEPEFSPLPHIDDLEIPF